MSFIRQLSLYISLTCLVFLIIGLFKPWVMLWWEHVQNRRKVIRLYGSMGLMFYGIYWVLYFLNFHV
jgi:hypothetical protein